MLSLAGLLACEQSRDEPRRPASSTAPPIAVGYVEGCRALFDDRRCVLDLVGGVGELSLAIDDVAPTLLVEVRAGEQTLAQRVGPGLLRVPVRAPLGDLHVIVAEHVVFALELLDTPTPYRDAWARVLESTDVVATQATLQRERAQATGVTAQLLECDVRTAAFADHDTPRLEQALHADLDALCRLNLAIMAGREALEQFDFPTARARLSAGKPAPWLVGPALDFEYEEAVFDQRLGRLDVSLRRFTRVATRAHELDYRMTAAQADVMLGLGLVALGQFEAALQVTERGLALPGIDPSFRRELRESATWITLEARTLQPSLPDPTPELRALLAEYEAPGIEQDLDRAETTRVSLIIALVRARAFEAAEAELARLDQARLNLNDLTYVELQRAELAAASGQFELGRAHIERAQLYASLVSDFDTRLLVALGRADLEREAGRIDAARAAHADAESLADRIVLAISPQSGRSLFGGRLRAAQAEQLELLLELGDPAAALCSVLRARARNLRSLAAGRERSQVDTATRERIVTEYERARAELVEQANGKWQVPRAELEALERELAESRERLDALTDEAMRLLEGQPEPWQCADVWRADDPTQALLTMHPGTQGRWWFALARGPTVRWVPVGPDELEHMAEQGVAAVLADATFDDVTSLQIVPILDMIAVDMHMFPRVRELGVAVSYGLGLGRAREVAATPSKTAAVLRGRSNLLHAASEAAHVRERLRAADWVTTPDWQPQAAAQPSLLHFVGHGSHAGVAGWDSKLVLAERELTSGELLAFQQAPRWVVLDACESSSADARAIDGGMNMATAFLLAGAEWVIAPDRLLDDALAEEFARVLYAEGMSAETPVHALGRVHGDPRFAAWRVWGR